MSQRVFAVTGSASGMGAAIVDRLRVSGAQVIGVDQRQRADVQADLSCPDGRREAAAAVVDRSRGRLDGLIACAGISGFHPAGAAAVVSTNYFGTVEFAGQLRDPLAEGQGAVVAITSNSATTTPDVDGELVELCLSDDEPSARHRADQLGGAASYAAAKLAASRWVRRQAPTEDWAGAGIRLNAIAPGFITTPLSDEMAAHPVGRRVLEGVKVPLGRPGRPEEVAALVEFMVGDGGAYLAGSLIYLDGGMEARIRADDWPVSR